MGRLSTAKYERELVILLLSITSPLAYWVPGQYAVIVLHKSQRRVPCSVRVRQSVRKAKCCTCYTCFVYQFIFRCTRQARVPALTRTCRFPRPDSIPSRCQTLCSRSVLPQQVPQATQVRPSTPANHTSCTLPRP